jgi:hypothetical protein
MVSIVLLIIGGPVLGLPIVVLGVVLLYVAALLTLWSMALYLRAAWPSLTAAPSAPPEPHPGSGAAKR